MEEFVAGLHPFTRLANEKTVGDSCDFHSMMERFLRFANFEMQQCLCIKHRQHSHGNGIAIRVNEVAVVHHHTESLFKMSAQPKVVEDVPVVDDVTARRLLPLDVGIVGLSHPAGHGQRTGPEGIGTAKGVLRSI